MRKHPNLWILLIAFLVACSGVGFNYRVYGLNAESYNGMLLGPKAADDIPLAVCQPDAINKGKCIVLLADEYYKLKAAYQTLEQQLSDCQRGP